MLLYKMSAGLSCWVTFAFFLPGLYLLCSMYCNILPVSHALSQFATSGQLTSHFFDF